MPNKPENAITELFRQVHTDPAKMVEGLATEFEKKIIRKGESWIRPGQYCQHIGFLKSGLLRAAVETDEGLHTRWAYLPGQFFLSLQSFTRQIPSIEYIIAVEDCEIYLLGRQRWLALYEQHQELRHFWTQTLETLAGCFEDRVHALLYKDATARYQHMLDHYPEFILYVPQRYVAEMLGIAPRHLSRIRKEISSTPLL
ncbi:MAG: Crp/Fnr family transcriptional regulator [Bacteroidota bacterium]